MRIEEKIQNEYFEWMYGIVCGERFSSCISYRKLLARLHNTEFIYILQRDENRAEDGIDLRYRFEYDNQEKIHDVKRYLDGPCSVLEMMIALAIRCEESIMDNPNLGNRTGQWFWGMIANLGLGDMVDDKFDRVYVDMVISRLLNREYEPNGKGGLFTVRNRKKDLRTVEIWCQLQWFLDNII